MCFSIIPLRPGHWYNTLFIIQTAMNEGALEQVLCPHIWVECSDPILTVDKITSSILAKIPW